MTPAEFVFAVGGLGVAGLFFAALLRIGRPSTQLSIFDARAMRLWCNIENQAHKEALRPLYVDVYLPFARKSVDRFGTLYRWRVESPSDERNPDFVLLEVINPADKQKVYLRVDAKCRTPHEAVAWTFGFPDKILYDPIVET